MCVSVLVCELTLCFSPTNVVRWCVLVCGCVCVCVFPLYSLLVLCLALNEMGTVGKIKGFSSSTALLLFPLLLPLFLALSPQQSVAISTSLNYTKFRQVGSLRLARIERHLDRINKPPLLTIKVYMCVCVYVCTHRHTCVCVWFQVCMYNGSSVC